MAYFITICDYGFNLSVTKQISIFRNEKLKIDEIFSSVILSKVFLGIISVIILLFITLSVQRFSMNADVFLFSFGIVIGNILFPIWFYQGIENMKFITIITFVCRSIGTVMIFIVINDVNDYPLLVLIYSSISILIGISGLLLAVKKFRINLLIPTFSSISFQLKEGFQIFISIVAINLYSTTNIFILGLLVNNTAVGYFVAADKIRAAVQNILLVISQTVYPHVNKLYRESYDRFIKFNKNLLIYQSLITFFISSLLYLFAEEIVLLLLGKQFVESVWVLRILAILPLLSSFTTIFTMNILIPMNQKNYFMKSFLAAAIVSLIFALAFVPIYQQLATAAAFVLAELTAASLSFWFVYSRLKLFGR